jgi:hypothetical protein
MLAAMEGEVFSARERQMMTETVKHIWVSTATNRGHCSCGYGTNVPICISKLQHAQHLASLTPESKPETRPEAQPLSPLEEQCWNVLFEYLREQGCPVDVINVEADPAKNPFTKGLSRKFAAFVAQREASVAPPVTLAPAVTPSDVPPGDCYFISYARGGGGYCNCGRLGTASNMVPYAAYEQHMLGATNNPETVSAPPMTPQTHEPPAEVEKRLADLANFTKFAVELNFLVHTLLASLRDQVLEEASRHEPRIDDGILHCRACDWNTDGSPWITWAEHIRALKSEEKADE